MTHVRVTRGVGARHGLARLLRAELHRGRAREGHDVSDRGVRQA
jgi:hypothetical protein